MPQIVINLALALLLVGALAIGWARWQGHRARIAAEDAWRAIDASARTGVEPPVFDPAAIADQPEIARRYLTHAITPGTPLQRLVRLRMKGVFRLGTADTPRSLTMQARQILRAPDAFVWIATMQGGGMRISGSDGLHGGNAWTAFRLFGTIPLVNLAGTRDLLMSAGARPAFEAVWAPASLHPAHGAVWEQTGPDSAAVTVPSVPETMVLNLDLARDGAVMRLWGQRWTNANPEGRFQWQPFGALVHGESRHGGFTIPTRLSVGNHFGTDAFFAFFEAEVTEALYGPGPTP